MCIPRFIFWNSSVFSSIATDDIINEETVDDAMLKVVIFIGQFFPYFIIYC